jgi:hypothetical protein
MSFSPAEAGVALAEMPAPEDKPKYGRKFIRAGSAAAREHSGRSLHSKTYIVDRKRLYIGSANFDPGSVALNTELGLVIDSTALAEEMAQAFEGAARNGYRLSLGQDNKICWTDLRDDRPQCVNVEPGTTIMARLLVQVLARLPLERFLEIVCRVGSMASALKLVPPANVRYVVETGMAGLRLPTGIPAFLAWMNERPLGPAVAQKRTNRIVQRSGHSTRLRCRPEHWCVH